jgi:hypothetical protein
MPITQPPATQVLATQPPATPPPATSPASAETNAGAAPLEIDAGVIRDARRRQRRRRATGIAIGAWAVGIAIAALLIGGGNGKPRAPGEPSPAGPLKLALVHGRAFVGGQPALIGVVPSLQAGNVGVCVRLIEGGSCNGPFPTAADPVYGGGDSFFPKEKVGPAGEIDAIFTGPGVAAMRVAHLGTFKAEPAAGLPLNAKQILFYRPPGSRGTVLAPGLSPHVLQVGFDHVHYGPALTETLLDRTGHPIPIGKSSAFTLPNSYWQGPQRPPARGRCAMRSSLGGVRTAWGQVATEIAPDRDITTPGWFTCLHTWYTLGGASYETALLLNAFSPGSAPAPLWGATPVPGHPGIVQIPSMERALRVPSLSPAEAARFLAMDTKSVGRAKAEQVLRESKRRTFWDVLVPPTVARRIGPAWVLVRFGNSLAQRLAFLEGLHVTRMKLWRGRG